MLRKFLLFIFALVAIGVALFSYSKYYARKDVAGTLADARLSASVRTALALNRHLKNMDIDVTVTGGAVNLTGAVATPIQKELAREIASSIKGAKNIQNNLSVNKHLSRKSDENERSLGEKLDDLTIEASIKTALMLNDNIRARKISVKSLRGKVTLTGSVNSLAESELARKIADDVDGVLSVDGRLVLGDDAAPADKTLAEKVDDATIVAQVRAALMVNRNIDSTEIEIASQSGIVTLTGLARSGAEKDLIEKIAAGCWGVKGVVNEIRIMGSGL